MPFTQEEKSLLDTYVTNVEADIFCVKNLQGMTGPAYARYSRAKGGFKDVLLKEFIREGVLDPQHATELIERILIAFGDDSVGELEGAHLSLENISVLATKEIEERRIGGSPLEQSTRYVFYDQRIDGQYRYYRDLKIMASAFASEYVATMDFIFNTYCSLMEPLKDYYSRLKPLEDAVYDINADGVSEQWGDLVTEEDKKAFRTTYNADLRTRACDTLRSILPIATKTNVGFFGNGRFFQHALTALYSSFYSEANRIAEHAHQELNKIIPVYVRRAKRSEYMVQVHVGMRKLALELFKEQPVQLADDEVDLLDHGEDAIVDRLKEEEEDFNASTLKHFLQDEFDNFTVTCMLYPYLQHPFRQIRSVVRKLSQKKKQHIIMTYVGNRTSRRDRPYRAFEAGYPYTFDLVTDFGTYKDLMRHRINTQLRQLFSPLLGFQMPHDVVAAGFADRAEECHAKVVALYRKLYPELPYEASYVTLHGSRVRWLLGFNDREAFHLLELRTGPQGHPNYRRVAQEMHRRISKQSPWRAAAMKFVDYGTYEWARAASEARQRAAEKELSKRFKKTPEQ